ncbi:hypothetical protein BV898_16581 [Hypsibius exemplaris]|uniref:SCP domain-containing protein n=1 Tax=Hypsibius exemplaris TaxID=2072580 RepID=A0A9X6NE03_HYPEX|nr:hypothetical protein BV898_16581 [Hypsibius exemplaris]
MEWNSGYNSNSNSGYSSNSYSTDSPNSNQYNPNRNTYSPVQSPASYGNNGNNDNNMYMYVKPVPTSAPGCDKPQDPSCAATRATILGLINKVRRGVKAADMLQVSWDPTAAADAQRLAAECRPAGPNAHDDPADRHSCGQNIASDVQNWEGVFQLWNQEVKDFKWGMKCNLRATGNYTQNVWASSNKISCGWRACGGKGNFVCNYCQA